MGFGRDKDDESWEKINQRSNTVKKSRFNRHRLWIGYCVFPSVYRESSQEERGRTVEGGSEKPERKQVQENSL